MRDLIVAKLGDEKIKKDLLQILREGSSCVELDERSVVIPPNAPLEVVARSYHCYEFEVSFGSHYRVLVAIGGVRSVANGIVDPGLCFATLWYSSACELITVDFSELWP